MLWPSACRIPASPVVVGSTMTIYRHNDDGAEDVQPVHLLCHKGFAPSFCRSVLMVSALAICKLQESPSDSQHTGQSCSHQRWLSCTNPLPSGCNFVRLDCLLAQIAFRPVTLIAVSQRASQTAGCPPYLEFSLFQLLRFESNTAGPCQP